MYKECRQPMGSICVEIAALNINDIKDKLIGYVDEQTKVGIQENLQKANETVEFASLKANEAQSSAHDAATSALQAADSANQVAHVLENYYNKTEIDDRIKEVSNSVTNIESSISCYQTKDNLVTTINASSSDEEYPSARAVYNIVGIVENLLSEV